MLDVFRNPTKSELNRLFKQHGALRAAKDHSTGDVYVWQAEGALHNEVISSLPQNGTIDSAGILWDASDYGRLRK